MRVWVTRAQPGAEATARRLADLGLDPFVWPLLEVRDLPAAIDLEGVGALAFTSANGVRAFAALRPERDLPVFAVGEATAEAAMAAGFTEVSSPHGDVQALAALIGRRSGSGDVLHVGARRLARPLPPAIRTVAVYETAPCGPPVDLTGVDALMVHSPRAGGLVGAVAAARGLAAFCISAAAAAALGQGFRGPVAIAPFPNEAALLKLVSDWSPKRP